MHPRSNQGSWDTICATSRMFIVLPLFNVSAECMKGGIAHGIHPFLLGDRLEQGSDLDRRRQKVRIVDISS